MWLRDIAPGKLAKSTLARERQDIDRFLPVLGHYKLTELRPEHFRQLYAGLRKVKNQKTGKPLSECTVEGVHACLCLSLIHILWLGAGSRSQESPAAMLPPSVFCA